MAKQLKNNVLIWLPSSHEQLWAKKQQNKIKNQNSLKQPSKHISSALAVSFEVFLRTVMTMSQSKQTQIGQASH